MKTLTPVELEQLERLMRECKALLRSLPKDDPDRCQIGRALRLVERRVAVVQYQQKKRHDIGE